MFLNLLAWLAVTVFATPPPPSASPPRFECIDREGAAIRIWLGPARNAMQLIDKKGTREIPLSGENVAREFKGPGESQVYNGWNPKGKDLYTLLEISEELMLHYVVEEGTTRIKISVVTDHRERLGLACKTSGYAVSVVPAESEGPGARRYAALLAEGSGLRTRKGTLRPIGVMEVDAAVRRMFNSPDFKTQEARDLFAELAGPSIKIIDPRSIDLIRERLPKPISDYWKSILVQVNYSIFPFVNRYTTWIKEGARPEPKRDHESIIAGFIEFVASSGYRDKDVRTFFLADITPSLKTLTDADVAQIRIPFDPDTDSFFMQSWSKAIGRRTLSDFPDVEQMVNDIAAIVRAKELDPQAIQRKLEIFLKSSMAADPEARGHFTQAASVQLRKLNARQREDVMGWLEEGEKKLFLQMVK